MLNNNNNLEFSFKKQAETKTKPVDRTPLRRQLFHDGSLQKKKVPRSPYLIKPGRLVLQTTSGSQSMVSFPLHADEAVVTNLPFHEAVETEAELTDEEDDYSGKRGWMDCQLAYQETMGFSHDFKLAMVNNSSIVGRCQNPQFYSRETGFIKD